MSPCRFTFQSNLLMKPKGKCVFSYNNGDKKRDIERNSDDGYDNEDDEYDDDDEIN